MSSNNLTKKAFAKSLKMLLERRPLHMISIQDITSCSGTGKATFYYHFKDKQDLVKWIFNTDVLEYEESFNDSYDMGSCFVDVCSYLFQNRSFYMNCFSFVEENPLIEFVCDLFYELWKKYLHSIIGQNSSTSADLMARMNAHAFAGLISDWLKMGMHPEEILIMYNELSATLVI